MNNYCDTTPEINSVPSTSAMTLFKPYFEIAEDSTSFTVYIKVNSECYFISNSASGYPAAGACGDPSDLHHTITINTVPGCSSSTETVLSISLSYSESPNGNKINIYVVDNSDSGKVKGESKSAGRIH